MRSRAARLTSTALALLASGAAGYFLFSTEQAIADRQARVRTFEQYARDAARQLSEARVGLQAYVAAGQSVAYWTPKVATLVADAATNVDGLRQTAASTESRKTLIDLSAAVTEFGNIDKRAREYLNGEQPLMAADVVFSEGMETAADASAGVEAARVAERQDFETFEREERRQQAYAVAGAGGFVLFILALLALSRPAVVAAVAEDAPAEAEPVLSIKDAAKQTPARQPPDTGLANGRALEAAAELCNQFSRVQDLSGLQAIVGRIAGAIDATGVIVWLGSTQGADLRPAVASGYSDKVLQLLPPVPVTADNAAAAAYRSGTLQVIAEQPGISLGAVVAPLLTAEGCIGALTAEIRKGGEGSAHVQSLAMIFASQLASVLSATAAQAASGHASRIASG